MTKEKPYIITKGFAEWYIGFIGAIISFGLTTGMILNTGKSFLLWIIPVGFVVLCLHGQYLEEKEDREVNNT